MSEENNVQMESQVIENAPELAEEVKSEAPVPGIKKVKLKVDGKELEEELPFEIRPEHEEYFRNQLQLAKAAQKRMQETAELRKNSDQMKSDFAELITSLKDPAVLKDFLTDPRVGVDVKEFAKAMIEEELKEQEKSPEQKELERLRKEREDFQKKVMDMQKEKEEAERSRELQEVMANTEKGIISSIKENGLSTDARVVKRFAEAMKAGLQYGVELTPEELGPIIKKQMYDEAKFYLEQLQDEEFSDFVGKDRLNRVRQKLLTSAKKVVPSPKQVADTGKIIEKDDLINPKRKEYKRANDFFRSLK